MIMPKRPDNLESVKLAIELLRRIPKHRTTTAAELHEHLNALGIERELRTIQRQLDELSQAFDIERDDSTKPYRYRWLPQSTGINIPGLSNQESLLLTLAEQQLKDLLPANLMKSMASFFTQARSNLSHADADSQRAWLSKVRVVSTTQPLLPPKIKPGVFEQVSNALYGDHWLRVEYKNANGKITHAEVMPLGLAQQGTRMYLVCRFRGYDNERNLALNRLVSAEASTMTFKRPKEFDLRQYDDNGGFGNGRGKKIRLTFQIEKKAGVHLLESMLSADQQVTEVGNYYEVSATVVETRWLNTWLLGFGSEIHNVKRVLV